MEPVHEFGKEAMEKLRIKKEKNARIMKMLKIGGLAVAVTAVILLWGDMKDMFASGGNNKAAKEQKANDKKGADGQGMQPSSEITIIKKWDLPEELKEISGLSYLDNERFACVQDELGTVFIYNTTTSSIENKIAFGAAGDYEGLAMVNGAAWILRSDGKLFEVSGINAAKPTVKEYSTLLTAEQDTEGLCYDPDNNRLLLAVKDEGNGVKNSYKGIYAFDLASKKMPSEPVFKIDLSHDVFTAPASGKKNKQSALMPSAIAINPVTKDMFITEGRKSRLLVTNAQGAIKQLYQLDNGVFEQPEGISIRPDGEIFISNEGTKAAGNIINVKVDLSGKKK